MRVALIHPQLILKGGLETRLFNYLQFFRGRGDEVTIITAKVDESLKLPKEVSVIKIDLSIIPKPVRMLFFNRRLKPFIDGEKFDFVLSLGRTSHQHALLCPGNHIGYLKAMKKRLLTPIDYMNIRLDKKGFENSKVVLAASVMIKDELMRYYNVSENKIKVAYPPVNVEVFNMSLKKEKERLRKKYGLSKDKTTFLFVSTSHDRKNFGLLQDIFNVMKAQPIELAVAGFEIRAGSPNIRYLGFIRPMQEVYAAADFLIHPAFYEPFGQVVSESICCGTPVIISEKTGAREVVSADEGIIVKDYKVESWMNAIQYAMKTPFSISSEFAFKKKLTLKQHMEVILERK